MPDFDVSVSDVLDRLPNGAGQVTATSRPLNTARVEEIIGEEESNVEGVLRQSSKSVDTLSDSAKSQMRKVVIWQAAAECVDVMGWFGSDGQGLRKKANQLLDRFAKAPGTLDESPSIQRAQKDTARTEFQSDTYQY